MTKTSTQSLKTRKNTPNKKFIPLSFFNIKNLVNSKIICTFAVQLREILIEGKSDILEYSLRHTNKKMININ